MVDIHVCGMYVYGKPAIDGCNAGSAVLEPYILPLATLLLENDTTHQD